MISKNWWEEFMTAEKTCIIVEGTRKVHYKFLSKQEMVEEYNVETNVLTRRAWKTVNRVGGEGSWEVEIGDPIPNAEQPSLETVGIKENSNAPVVSRRITKTSLEWRIRNLSYPLPTYSVTAEPENHCITVRTSNKKYFKKLAVPDLQRVGLQPEQSKIKFVHKFNTLVITYEKPHEVLQLERKVLEELAKLKTSTHGDLPGCNPS